MNLKDLHKILQMDVFQMSELSLIQIIQALLSNKKQKTLNLNVKNS